MVSLSVRWIQLNAYDIRFSSIQYDVAKEANN